MAPEPPQLRSGVQSKPGPQKAGKRRPELASFFVVRLVASCVRPRRAAKILSCFQPM